MEANLGFHGFLAAAEVGDAGYVGFFSILSKAEDDSQVLACLGQLVEHRISLHLSGHAVLPVTRGGAAGMRNGLAPGVDAM
jgi:hypothetical protein